MADKRDIWLILLDCGDDVIMVKKAIIEDLVNLASTETLAQIIAKNKNPLALDTDFAFKEWARTTRSSLNITQLEVEEATGIGQEELSKFECGKINFGKKRKTALRNFLITKSGKLTA